MLCRVLKAAPRWEYGQQPEGQAPAVSDGLLLRRQRPSLGGTHDPLRSVPGWHQEAAAKRKALLHKLTKGVALHLCVLLQQYMSHLSSWDRRGFSRRRGRAPPAAHPLPPAAPPSSLLWSSRRAHPRGRCAWWFSIWLAGPLRQMQLGFP